VPLDADDVRVARRDDVLDMPAIEFLAGTRVKARVSKRSMARRLRNRVKKSLGWHCQKVHAGETVFVKRIPSMQPFYIVTEETWSISIKASSLVGSSEQPLFSSGAKVVAYAYAKQRASEFQYSGVHEGADEVYWWGRNEGDDVNRRFVMRPAPA
jgi:hypothetical protein